MIPLLIDLFCELAHKKRKSSKGRKPRVRFFIAFLIHQQGLKPGTLNGYSEETYSTINDDMKFN